MLPSNEFPDGDAPSSPVIPPYGGNRRLSPSQNPSSQGCGIFHRDGQAQSIPTSDLSDLQSRCLSHLSPVGKSQRIKRRPKQAPQPHVPRVQDIHVTAGMWEHNPGLEKKHLWCGQRLESRGSVFSRCRGCAKGRDWQSSSWKTGSTWVKPKRKPWVTVLLQLGAVRGTEAPQHCLR